MFLASELQGEVENLALRLFYMQNAKEDVRSDIAIMRRAAEKADTEVSKAEIEKQKQDLFVDRLVERVDKLKEEIAMYEAQLTAQLEETKAAKEQLMEAYMEIEVHLIIKSFIILLCNALWFS
jgi:chromosome segregation ATPase